MTKHESSPRLSDTLWWMENLMNLPVTVPVVLEMALRKTISSLQTSDHTELWPCVHGSNMVAWVQVTVDICMEEFLLNFVSEYAIRLSVNVSVSVKTASWISLCGALNILVDTVQVVQVRCKKPSSFSSHHYHQIMKVLST